MSKKDEVIRDCVVKLGNVKCYVVVVVVFSLALGWAEQSSKGRFC